MSRSITPNPVSSQAITVSSAAGFNAGDLVYFNGSTGDYGTPPLSAAPATVSVPITAPTPLLSGLLGANSSDVGIYGGCRTKEFAAILTNGNIVQGFFNPTTFEPSFRIVTTSGTVVVATTSISATFVQNASPNISVAALTGGGFVVAWNNSSGGTASRPCYAIYSNTGTVVTAAQQDTTAGVAINNGYPIRLVATPSGGFIISFWSTPNTYARGYGATGTGVFAWVTLATNAASPSTGLAVRNNGDFMLTGTVSSSSNVYAIWSATGTVVLGSTSFAPVAGNFTYGCTDATCLSDGTTFVIGYAIYPSSINSFAFRFLPTGNVLGSEFYIPVANTYKSAGLYPYVLTISALSSNRFILIGVTQSGGSYPISYAVFDSAGVCLSGTSGTTSTAAVPVYIPQAYFAFSVSQITAIETPSGFISMYYVNKDNSVVYSMQASTINATTYALTSVLSSNQVVGSAVAVPTAYARSGSSPLGAAYSITPGNYGAAGTFGAFVKTPEIVDAANAVNLSTATLPDGRVLIGYQDSSNNIKVAVYSITGVLTQTLMITAGGGGGSIQTFSKLSIATLTSGKFVISYGTSTSSVCDVKLYSNTFTQIGSTVSITGINGGTNNGYYAVVSGLTGDRYIVVYPNTSNWATYRVYDNTNSVLIADTVFAGNYTLRYLAVCGYSNGGFLVSGRDGSNLIQTGQFANPSGNTFTQTVNFAAPTGATSGHVSNNRAVANTYGFVYLLYNYGAGYITYYTSTVGVNQLGPNPAISGLSSSEGSAVGVSGNGVGVISCQISGVMQLVNGIDSNVSLSATLVKPYVAGSTYVSQNSMTPSYGSNIGIAYIDENQKVNYMIVCGNTLPSSITVTSNDPSTPIAIYPGATSATPAIQNTIFAGVALQTVPPGGAGLVQVNGTAQLGSTYPAGTTYRAFDHQSQGVPGVKGTITGRTITLQGNT
jgi:hypothetical protein